MGDVQGTILQREQFASDMLSFFLLSLINTALTPPEDQQLRRAKCKETSARDFKPEFDPRLYSEGPTQDPFKQDCF